MEKKRKRLVILVGAMTLLLVVLGMRKWLLIENPADPSEDLRLSAPDDPTGELRLHAPIFLNAQALQGKVEAGGELSKSEFDRAKWIACQGQHQFAQARALSALQVYEKDTQRQNEIKSVYVCCLGDKKWLVRSIAVKGLGRMHAVEAIPHIIPLLSNSDPEDSTHYEHKDVVETLSKLGYKVD